MNTTITQDLEGHVVEFFSEATSSAGGIVSNAPLVRRTALISHRRYVDGSQWTGSDSLGNRVILNANRITADLGVAQAGWGAW